MDPFLVALLTEQFFRVGLKGPLRWCILAGVLRLKGGRDSFREVPGMAMVLKAALTMRLAEPRLASFALLIAGVSFALYLRVQTVTHLIAVSMFWSLGFHIWIPLERSLALG